MRMLRNLLLIVLALCATPQAALAYYNPGTGRFLSRDPIGERDGANIMAFVGNRPVDRFDPFGLWKRDGWSATSANATAECGDNLWTLADYITGNGSDWKLLKLKEAIQDRQVVDVRPLLDELEKKMRKNVVKATGQLKSHFPAVGEGFDQGYGPGYGQGPGLNEAGVVAHFTGTGACTDCLGATRLVMAKGLIDTLKKDEFDKIAFNTRRMESELMRSRTVGSSGDMKPGDWGYFKNDSRYLTFHPQGGYQGENVIKVDGGQFWGHPGGVKSAEGWTQALIDAFNQGLAPADHITTIPGFTKSATFFDPPTVGMRVFDLRNKKTP